MRKPHRSSTVLPVCTDHSYLTGRLQRRVWGEIRQAGDTDRAVTALSMVCSSVSNRQNYSTFGDSPGQKVRWTKAPT